MSVILGFVLSHWQLLSGSTIATIGGAVSIFAAIKRDWKLLAVGLLILGALGIAFAYRIDAQVWETKYNTSQKALATATTSITNLNQAIIKQNTSIKNLGDDEVALQKQVDMATKKNQTLFKTTTALLVQLKNANVGKTCEDNMNYLRSQAPLLSQPPF